MGHKVHIQLYSSESKVDPQTPSLPVGSMSQLVVCLEKQFATSASVILDSHPAIPFTFYFLLFTFVSQELTADVLTPQQSDLD